MAVYFAYLNRSDVYYNTGVKCDFQRDFAPCYQALDRARADLQQALAIARKQGFPALARQTEEFLANVETRRQLVKSQESTHQIVQKTGVFRPTKAGDVLVTERFVTAPGPVPPIVTQFYQEAKRMESQAGGFADVALARNQYIEGLMNEMRGNNDAALAHYLKAVGTLERDRRALRDDPAAGRSSRTGSSSTTPRCDSSSSSAATPRHPRPRPGRRRAGRRFSRARPPRRRPEAVPPSSRTRTSGSRPTASMPSAPSRSSITPRLLRAGSTSSKRSPRGAACGSSSCARPVYRARLGEPGALEAALSLAAQIDNPALGDLITVDEVTADAS